MMVWHNNNREIPARISHALESHDLAEVRRLLTQHPEFLRLAKGTDKWLGLSAGRGDLEAVKLFVDLGLDVDESSSLDFPATALVRAASEGHREIVHWLVDHGAKIDHYRDGHTTGSILRSAVIGGHFEIVKFLIDHGADIHGHWHGVNALMDAEFYGQREIAAYLRSLGAKDLRETTPPDYTEAHRQLIKNRVEERGPLSGWSLDLPGDPAVTIHHIAADAAMHDPPAQTLFTIGLSDKFLPDEDDEFHCTELRMFLPPDWPLDESPNNWPLEWLKRIAMQLRESDRLYATEEQSNFPPFFMNGDPPRPLASGTKLCGWIGLRSSDNHIQMPDCRWISLQDLHPIYAEERDFVLSKPSAWETFMQRLEDRGIPMHIDPQRENVAM